LEALRTAILTIKRSLALIFIYIAKALVTNGPSQLRWHIFRSLMICGKVSKTL
jgi:hypothetical protein